MRKEASHRTPLVMILLLFATVFFGARYSSARQENGAAQTSPSQNSASQVNPNAVSSEVHVWPVQGKVYMLVGAGGNITMQVGDDGILLVDAGLKQDSDVVIKAIRSVSNKPLRYIINTHVHTDHTGGNEALAKMGSTIAGGNVVGDIGASASEGATIIAFQSVLDRLSETNGKDAAPEGAWPTDTYTTAEKNLFFNGESIKIIHEPAAHTDGDSIVYFRHSDVVSTGDIFTTTRYPIIDLQRGGSIQGVIAALNQLLYEITIPGPKQEGGTMIVPGHGRLCDQADLVVYQEMVTIIRDRIQDMVNKGMSLDQVKAAKPTRDYDNRYGSNTGIWTTDMFVEAVYKGLSDKKEAKQ